MGIQTLERCMMTTWTYTLKGWQTQSICERLKAANLILNHNYWFYKLNQKLAPIKNRELSINLLNQMSALTPKLRNGGATNTLPILKKKHEG